jgi:hypothetical protein
MTVPSVRSIEIDGGLGTLPSEMGNALVVIGAASQGPYNTPVAFTRAAPVVRNYGATGELVEACAYHTNRRGRAVIPVRARAIVPGTVGALTVTSAAGTATAHAVTYSGMTPVIKSGMSPPAITLSGTPLGLYALKLQCDTEGAQGVATIKVSTDNGATWNAPPSLVTATDLVLTGTGLTAHCPVGTYHTNNTWTADSIGALPVDDFDAVITIVTGGDASGSALTCTISQDGGLSPPSPVTGISGGHVTVGGVQIDLAGTWAAGDTITFTAVASRPTAGQIAEAIASLASSKLPFSTILIASAIGAAEFDAIEGAVATLGAINKPQYWIGHVRIPAPGETSVEYVANVLTPLASKTTVRGSVVSRDALVSSSLTGRLCRRSPALTVASFETFVSPEIDIAELTLGAIPGVQLTDLNGNVIFHDEMIEPGDDDLGFLALRTWEGRDGVYVNRPRIKCAAGSDFMIAPYRKVMNLASKLLRSYLETRLGKALRAQRRCSRC